MRFIEADQEFRVRKVVNGYILTHETKIPDPKDPNDYNWDTVTYVFNTADEAFAKGSELLKGIING